LEGEREVVNFLVEVKAKKKFSELGWEVVNRLIEIVTKRQEVERGRKRINWRIK
jgi:hypothetical protein